MTPTDGAGFDPVARPRHYNAHPSGVECIEVTEPMGFCLGNAVKYVWRCDAKGAPLEDLRKALWYVDRALARRLAAEVWSPGEVPEYEVSNMNRVRRTASGEVVVWGCDGAATLPEPVVSFLREEPSGFKRAAVEALCRADSQPDQLYFLELARSLVEQEVAHRATEGEASGGG